MAADRSRSSPAVSCLSRSSSFGLDYAGWKNCWNGLMCFTPRRRVKYHSVEICTTPQSAQKEIPAANGSLRVDTPNQLPLLPPVMGAPPPSPVSAGVTLEALSPQLSTASHCSLFPESSNRLSNHTDTHIRSFMLDNGLLTPPLNSPLTTATATPLSTAPFTPPPELAHLTTPSSPELMTLEVFENSGLECKSSLSEKFEELSLQTSSTAAHLQLIHWLHSCSPIGQFVRYNSGASSPEILSPLPERVSLQKGTTCTNAVNSCFLAALKDATFEGPGMLNSKIFCDESINQRQTLHQSGGLIRKNIPASTVAHEICEQNDDTCPGSSLDTNSHCCRPATQAMEVCCSRCGELSAKCKDLAEALEQTRKKLTLVESKVISMGERERRLKQLIHWMQLSFHWLAGLFCKHGALCMMRQAKLRQDNIYQLSEELSWQGTAFLDLQECRLAEAGISISNTEKDDTEEHLEQ